MVPAWAAAVRRNGVFDGRGWRPSCHLDALCALRRGSAGGDRRLAMDGGGAMTYVLIAVSVFVAALLFQARGVIAVILCKSKMQVGDYDGALRTMRWVSLGIPNVMTLHAESLWLESAGRLSEAEQRLRKALTLAAGSKYRVERLHACLGNVLIGRGPDR